MTDTAVFIYYWIYLPEYTEEAKEKNGHTFFTLIYGSFK